MHYLSSEYLEDLTVRLCAIPSVSGCRREENRCADAIAKELGKIALDSVNPMSVDLISCEHDPLQRKAVLAFLKASKITDKTILLTGHFDVVSTEMCGDLSEEAFDLQQYGKELAKRTLSEAVAEDIRSGDWLFGRGAMDMKAGLALFIGAIGALASAPDLAVNILFLAVPDEEADSAGMRGALPEFVRFIKAHHLDVVAALTGEPCFWTQPVDIREAYRPYYTGTTGKIMPAFLVLGTEAHVGCYYEGFSSALLLARIVCRMEANPELLDHVGEDVLAPPACLYMQTRRSDYSVTLPERAAAYFNVLTVHKTPCDVLEECRNIATEAARETEAQLEKSRQAYELVGGGKTKPSPVNVVSAAELRLVALQLEGGEENFSRQESTFWASQSKEIDARELSLRTMEFWAQKAQIQGPVVVVGFVPPFYPSRLNKRSSFKEKRLRSVMEQIVKEAERLVGDQAVKLTEVFGGITDLSFLGFDGDTKDIDALQENLPAWKRVYWIPIKELLEIDIPIANMAGAGKDAHKATERLERRFSFEIAPQLLMRTIEQIALD